MSWRAESTFTPTSKLADEEKNFLKLSKKIREIWKLEEKQKNGEKLEPNQLDKVTNLDTSIKEMIALVKRLPKNSEVLAKNPDMADLVPSSALKEAEQRRQVEDKKKAAREAEAQRKKEIVEFQPRHDRPVMDVTVSEDGKWVYTCSKDKVVLGWSTSKKLLEVVRTYGGFEGAVYAVDVSPGPAPLLAAGGADGKVLFYSAEVRDKKPAVVMPDGSLNHGGMVKALRWCPHDKQTFATCADKLGNDPPCIALWTVAPNVLKQAAGKAASLVTRITKIPARASAIAWDPVKGKMPKLFSSHDNGYVAVWKADETGALLTTIKLHTEPVTCVTITADGSTLFSSSRDRTVAVVDITSRECPVILRLKTNRPLNAVAVSEDFKKGSTAGLVVGGGQSERDVTTTKEVEGEFEAQIYDWAGSKGDMSWSAAGKGHFGPIHQIRFLPNKGFVTAGEDGCVWGFDLEGNVAHTDNKVQAG
eukprot:TRINITY_DN74105_c0_g1_i1.p1 TRINITY_DN74105_c0_g1~~TRINITY_DN74105_c0_g1_i1.p1  ORF type:complete len:475 (+),score=121.74 TRINITY_DN74105_c0_g1_i1:143-1567(+)